jgi:hypothetical protein
MQFHKCLFFSYPRYNYLSHQATRQPNFTLYISRKDRRQQPAPRIPRTIRLWPVKIGLEADDAWVYSLCYSLQRFSMRARILAEESDNLPVHSVCYTAVTNTGQELMLFVEMTDLCAQRILLFTSVGWYVSELRPPYSFIIPHMIYEYGEPRWNDIGRGIRNNSKKNLSLCQFVHKPHVGWPGTVRWQLSVSFHPTSSSYWLKWKRVWLPLRWCRLPVSGEARLYRQTFSQSSHFSRTTLVVVYNSTRFMSI